jgi:hypothetical protein
MVGASDGVHWLADGAGREKEEKPIREDELFEEQPSGPFGWTPGTLALRRVLASGLRRFVRRMETHRGAGRGVGRARKARAAAEKLIDTLRAAPLLARSDAHFRALVGSRGRRNRDRRHAPAGRGGHRPGRAGNGWMFADGDGNRQVRLYLQRVARLLGRSAPDLGAVAARARRPPRSIRSCSSTRRERFYDVRLAPAGCAIVGGSIAQPFSAGGAAF